MHANRLARQRRRRHKDKKQSEQKKNFFFFDQLQHPYAAAKRETFSFCDIFYDQRTKKNETINWSIVEESK